MNKTAQEARDLAPHLVGLVIPGTYREEVILTLIQCADEIDRLSTLVNVQNIQIAQSVVDKLPISNENKILERNK